MTLQKNPWKLLDVTTGTGAEVEDLGAEGSDVTVAVTTGESP